MFGALATLQLYILNIVVKTPISDKKKKKKLLDNIQKNKRDWSILIYLQQFKKSPSFIFLPTFITLFTQLKAANQSVCFSPGFSSLKVCCPLKSLTLITCLGLGEFPQWTAVTYRSNMSSPSWLHPIKQLRKGCLDEWATLCDCGNPETRFLSIPVIEILIHATKLKRKL